MTDIKVLYGSETGNSESLAISSGQILKEAGFGVEVIDMADVTINDLKEFSNILIITSTWGDGEAPSNAYNLHEELADAFDVELPNLRYAVFGIGQSFYDHFAQAAMDFDLYLERLGAKRMLPLVKCDDDFDADFPAWIEEVKTKFK